MFFPVFVFSKVPQQRPHPVQRPSAQPGAAEGGGGGARVRQEGGRRPGKGGRGERWVPILFYIKKQRNLNNAQDVIDIGMPDLSKLNVSPPPENKADESKATR